MKKEGYYSSGQFARLADVSVRTIRFYDRQNILKPSYVNENGARFYTDADLARLQQILLLKYLGFSLEDIRTMTIGEDRNSELLDSLKLQERLVSDRIEQMLSVQEGIREVMAELRQHQEDGPDSSSSLDWQKIRSLIHLTAMEKTLSSQYKNASNLSARIALHSMYSVNKKGWFVWLFEQLKLMPDTDVLEIGCGDGTLWTQNRRLPRDIRIVLTDISEGMVRDARRAIGQDNLPGRPFTFAAFDCASIPFPDESFDLVVANHVLFYCADIERVLREVFRVLKKGGRFVCSAYGSDHMQEITSLVQEFDSHIVLSADRLYDRFGLDNGEAILSPVFGDRIKLSRYDDALVVDEARPLIEYILSCHGNQNSYIVDRYHEFQSFVEDKVRGGFRITKDAGIFICRR